MFSTFIQVKQIYPARVLTIVFNVMEILMTILLRHDVDNNLGLRLGIPKILAIEKKHDVRSVFFVRYDEISSASDVKLLQNIVRDGWEVGLHLVNTDGRNGAFMGFPKGAPACNVNILVSAFSLLKVNCI